MGKRGVWEVVQKSDGMISSLALFGIKRVHFHGAWSMYSSILLRYNSLSCTFNQDTLYASWLK